MGTATPTVYIFSRMKVLAEYNLGAATASPNKEYIYASSSLLATIQGTTTTYHHPDHLSVRLDTDASGNVVGQHGHYPFGESRYATGTTTKWQFTGYERDSESSNDYATARSYVNRFARFSSPDPLAGSILDPQSLNRYAYVRGDAANLVDPLGLTTCEADGQVVPCSMLAPLLDMGAAVYGPPGVSSLSVAGAFWVDGQWVLYSVSALNDPDFADSLSISYFGFTAADIEALGLDLPSEQLAELQQPNTTGGRWPRSRQQYRRAAILRLKDPKCKEFVEKLLGQLKGVDPGSDGATAASLAQNIQNAIITLSSTPGPLGWGGSTEDNHITVYPVAQDVPETLIHEAFHLDSTGGFSDIQIASYTVPTMHFNSDTLASGFWDPKLQGPCGPK